MTTEPSQNAIKVQVPEGFNLCVEFMGAVGQLIVNGRAYSVNENGLVLPANDQPPQNLEQRVLKVGDRLRDGTVVLSADLDKNKALFVPAEIYGGKAKFNKQDAVVESVNRAPLHGHKDWRRITDDEGKTLADNWAEVTTKDPELFWVASSYREHFGRVRCGGVAVWDTKFGATSSPVPVVRDGPARVALNDLAPA